MRKTEILNETYLGPFNHPDKLNVGDVQSMQYEDGDAGPFYLSDVERERKRNDRQSGETEKKKYTRLQLIKKINEKSPLTKAKGNLKDIQAIAQTLQIPIEFERERTEEGWMSKQKGMLQVLWERGFIDPSLSKSEVAKRYTVDGKKNKDGEINEGSSLKEMIMNLPDFKQEQTLLQYRAEQLGVNIDCSPKYHPEIAREGIEFCWGIAKNFYRTRRLQDKKRRENWLKLVSECTCNKSVITISSVRKFGRRIRRYMLAYHGLEAAKAKQADGSLLHFSDLDLEVPEMSQHLVERLVKVYKSKRKCHRNIFDSEHKFLSSVVDWIKRSSAIEEGAAAEAEGE